MSLLPRVWSGSLLMSFITGQLVGDENLRSHPGLMNQSLHLKRVPGDWHAQSSLRSIALITSKDEGILVSDRGRLSAWERRNLSSEGLQWLS